VRPAVALVAVSCLVGVSATGANIRSAATAQRVADADGKAMAERVARDLGRRPDAWVLFARGEREAQRKLLDGVRSFDTSIPLVGCDTRTGAFAVAATSIVGEVLLIGLAGEGVSFRAAMTHFPRGRDLPAAARDLASTLKPARDAGLLLLMSDAIVSHHYQHDPVKMYAALREVLGPHVGVVGGNAAYGGKPVYHDGMISDKALVGLMIAGDMDFAVVQEPGKVAISSPLAVTKTSGARQIVELDGRPVVDVYRETLGRRFDLREFDRLVNKGGGGFGRISRRFPHALLTNRGELFVRLAHGLAPWGEGRNLPVECYDLRDGDRTMVITRLADDQLGCVRRGMSRLTRTLRARNSLYLLFPCESNGFLMKEDARAFLSAVKAELPDGATAFGFMPCGEHCSLYEPDMDAEVGPARYYQLSYPMASVSD